MADKLKRLDALVRRLSSEHPGEVIATVEAMKRTLQSVGFDFNDLANHISAQAQPQPVVPEEKKAAPPKTWKEQVRHLLATYDDFTEWEKGFLASLSKWRVLTPKQGAVLERLWEEKTGERYWHDVQ